MVRHKHPAFRKGHKVLLTTGEVGVIQQVLKHYFTFAKGYVILLEDGTSPIVKAEQIAAKVEET